MRSSTRNIVSALGLGTIALSYVVGMNSTAAVGFSASGTGAVASATDSGTPSVGPSTTASGTPSPSASASPSTTSGSGKSSSSSSSGGTKSNGSSGSTSSSSGSSSGGSSSSGSSSGGSSSSSSGSSGSSSGSSSGTTKEGSAIKYQFGTVQVSVTKVGGKITAVNLIQAGATHGRDAAFSPLVTAAIQAQGSSFGNLTGATYTTEAFKQALDSALSKF